MGTVAVLPFVSSTCIISMHVTGYFEPNRQDLVFFLVEDIVAFSDDVVDFRGKSDKLIITASTLKQALMPDSPMLMVDKMPARATVALDMARPNQASPILADSASSANGQSLNNQAVGQTGGQTGGQAGGQSGGQSGGRAGAASGGGLLNSLNMLQTIDMAKNNWTEMLLQRVQKSNALEAVLLQTHASPDGSIGTLRSGRKRRVRPQNTRCHHCVGNYICSKSFGCFGACWRATL